MKTLIAAALFAVSASASNAALAAAATQTSAPITVIATVKLNPGTQDLFKVAAAAMVDETRKEPGVISYRLVQSANDPTEFATIELYKSQADIDQHMASAHLQKFFKAVGSLFAPGYPVLKTYQIPVK